MTEAPRSILCTREDADVASVVGTLRRHGPLGLDQLYDDPELAELPAERVDQALVAAWEQTLIFIDPRDRVVAL
jgi:hypothetical protein